MTVIRQQHRRAIHLRLAGYFELGEPTVRSTWEILHNLTEAKERARLEHVLSDMNRLHALWSGALRFEVLRRWAGSDRAHVVAVYREGLRSWLETDQAEPGRHIRLLSMLAEIFEVTGSWRDARGMHLERLHLLRGLDLPREEVVTLTALSWLSLLLGEVDDGDRWSREAATIARALGEPHTSIIALGNLATQYESRGEFDAEECVAEAREMGLPDTLLMGEVLLARLDAAGGSTDSARQRLQQVLATATDDRQRAELHYWLWKLGRNDEGGRMRDEETIDPNRSVEAGSSRFHRSEAERLYAGLLSRIPKHEYQVRLENVRFSPLTGYAGPDP